MCITNLVDREIFSSLYEEEAVYLRNDSYPLKGRIKLAVFHAVAIPIHTICSVADAALGTVSGTIALLAAFGGNFSSKIKQTVYRPCSEFTLRQFSTTFFSRELMHIAYIIRPKIFKTSYQPKEELEPIIQSMEPLTEKVSSLLKTIITKNFQKKKECSSLIKKTLLSSVDHVAHIAAFTSMIATIPLDLIIGTFAFIFQFIPTKYDYLYVRATLCLDLSRILFYSFRDISGFILPIYFT